MGRVGIVGAEAAKFTPETEDEARQQIRRLIRGAKLVVSGECHLGGVDIWAREEAEAAGIEFLPFPPKKLTWEGGYKQRNLQIARSSDLLACLTVKELPSDYHGMRFPQGCYHCGTGPEDHIKSGGCWTLKQAAKLGKRTELIVVGGPGAFVRFQSLGLSEPLQLALPRVSA